MAFEIERKFLVTSDVFKKEASGKTTIKQGYLSSLPERTVRIRIKGEKGYITIKGIPDASGITRFEWEMEIPVADAEELLKICEPGAIDKTRFEVENGGFIFEVDEFHGENEGLIIAEIELSHENDTFQKPDWLGTEVTGEIKYYNSTLFRRPFLKWQENSKGFL